MAKLALFTTLIFGAILTAVLFFKPNDFGAHIVFASEIARGIPATLIFYTHILYQVMVIVVSWSGASFIFSGVIAALIAHNITSALLFYYLNKKTVLVLGIMLAYPIFLNNPHSGLNFHNYITANAYHNPTVLMAKPLGLALLIGILSIWSRDAISRKHLMVIVAITILNAVAKPNYLIGILPAIIITLAIRYALKYPLRINALLAGVFLPATLMLAFQYFIVYMVSPSGNSITFRLLGFQQLSGATVGEIAMQFVASIAFPLVVYFAAWRCKKINWSLNFAWLAFICTAAISYSFIELGDRVGHGNWTWGSQIALFVLLSVSVKFLLDNSAHITTPLRRLCKGVLALHVLNGTLIFALFFIQGT